MRLSTLTVAALLWASCGGTGANQPGPNIGGENTPPPGELGSLPADKVEELADYFT